MPDPVVYFEILGADSAVLRDFYSGLFGWTITPVEETGGGYHRVAAEDGGIEGGVGAFPGAPSYVTVYVRVEDLAASVARAEELGATTIMAPREVMTGIETAVISDPEGHMIGLIKGL